MCHGKSGQCSLQICLNDDHHAAFFHVSNCITLCTELVDMVEILKLPIVHHGNRGVGAG